MNRRLRVLLVSEATRSGAGRSLWYLARGLRRAGCDVEVACSLQRDGHSAAWFQQLADEGVRLHRIPMTRAPHLWHDARAAWRLWRLMRRGRYQIVHTHAAKAGWLGRLMARLAGVPVVIHTPHAYPWINESHPRWLRWATRQVERVLARLTDRSLLVSFSQAEEACHERRVVPRRRMTVIPNGIDVARFSAHRKDAAAWRRQLGLAPDMAVVGTIGTLELSKGRADLLRAVSQLRSEGLPVQLVIVGDGPLRVPLEQLARRLGCAEAVTWAGYQQDVTPWLALMDLFVLPSRWEGMPLALLEAMAAGVPVIASRVHGAVDLIRPQRNGLLVPRQAPEHLALAIRYLLERPAEAALMAAAAQRMVSLSYSAETQVRATLRVYRRCRHTSLARRNYRYRLAKRLLDISIAAVLGLACAPLAALIAALIRLTSAGPAVIRQQRCGYRGRRFWMYKFRTMTVDRVPRITRLGAWLRRTGLDELPQLLNIIKGEMSLVGPRPHLPEVAAGYARHPVGRRRLTVPVGITGWAQLRGRQWSDWDRLALDAEYLARRSLRHDLWLLLATLPTLCGWHSARRAPTRPLPFPSAPATLPPPNKERTHAPATHHR